MDKNGYHYNTMLHFFFSVYIEENSGKGKAVAHISAIDLDDNLNGKIKLRVGSLLHPEDTSTFIGLFEFLKQK